jgi:hypothetical protein
MHTLFYHFLSHDHILLLVLVSTYVLSAFLVVGLLLLFWGMRKKLSDAAERCIRIHRQEGREPVLDPHHGLSVHYHSMEEHRQELNSCSITRRPSSLPNILLEQSTWSVRNEGPVVDANSLTSGSSNELVVNV